MSQRNGDCVDEGGDEYSVDVNFTIQIPCGINRDTGGGAGLDFSFLLLDKGDGQNDAVDGDKDNDDEYFQYKKSDEDI